MGGLPSLLVRAGTDRLAADAAGMGPRPAPETLGHHQSDVRQ